jgi:hypothetical protein
MSLVGQAHAPGCDATVIGWAKYITLGQGFQQSFGWLRAETRKARNPRKPRNEPGHVPGVGGYFVSFALFVIFRVSTSFRQIRTPHGAGGWALPGSEGPVCHREGRLVLSPPPSGRAAGGQRQLRRRRGACPLSMKKTTRTFRARWSLIGWGLKKARRYRKVPPQGFLSLWPGHPVWSDF